MSAVQVAAAAAVLARGNSSNIYNYSSSNNSTGGLNIPPRRVQQVYSVSPPLNWYESQRRRDWNPFKQYLQIHYPNLALSHCRGEHVVEYLRYLDKDKPKMHYETCAYFGNSHPPAGPCRCPPKQTWASLDALIGRLRATFHEEHGGSPKMNPFGAPAVRLYLREMRDAEAKAREIAYGKMTEIQNTKPQKQPQKSAMKRLFCSCF